MSQPVTLMVARRVADGCQEAFLAWLHEGETLAATYSGYLGSGVLTPPPGDNLVQIVFRFSDAATMRAWEHSVTRQAWLTRGQGLFEAPCAQRAEGMDGWFGSSLQAPPRWKQSIAVWLAFFPISLLFNATFGHFLESLALLPRILLSTLILTPVMVCVFIPLISRLLKDWLHRPSQPVLRGSALARRFGLRVGD